jgi:hypothetical protein
MAYWVACSGFPDGMWLGCAGFANQNFSLQSETKCNEIRFACVSHAHVKKKKFRSFSKRKNFASVSLRSENDGIFSLLFRFISLRSENDGCVLLPFCFISLRSENDRNFSLLFCFAFASFHFRFASDFYVSH